jgi:hypothetical protein
LAAPVQAHDLESPRAKLARHFAVLQIPCGRSGPRWRVLAPAGSNPPRRCRLSGVASSARNSEVTICS